MKKVAAVVSAIFLAGSLSVGQSAKSSTNPSNVSEADTNKSETKKEIDTRTGGIEKKAHRGAKKGHKAGKKSKKGSGSESAQPK